MITEQTVIRIIQSLPVEADRTRLFKRLDTDHNLVDIYEEASRLAKAKGIPQTK